MGQIISTLADYTKSQNSGYYLLIDHLDEPFVAEKIKYDMIQALFEAIKGLKKLPQLKVVVALRTDVYHKMIVEAPRSTVQLEKYEDYIIRIKWSNEQLKELAQKRIGHLFKRKYNGNVVHFDDIFTTKPDTKMSVWAYLIKRTLMRPRDIINFISECLKAAEGKSEISKSDFLKAEHAYSQLRLKTLIFEWKNTYPGIEALLMLLAGQNEYFKVSEHATSKLLDNSYEKMGLQKETRLDDIYIKIQKSVEGDQAHLEPFEICQQVFSRLHLVGAVSLKLSPNSAWQFFHENSQSINEHQIKLETGVKINPMLHSALGINPQKPRA
jgi:hypothetical protein